MRNGPEDTFGAGSEVTRHWQRRYAVGLWITDVLVVAAALLVSQQLRFSDGSTAVSTSDQLLPDILKDHWTVSVALLVLWSAALQVRGSRHWKQLGSGLTEYRRVVDATLQVFGLLAILAFAFSWDVSRGYLFVALPLGLALLLGSRWLWRRWLRTRRLHGECLHRALVIGEHTKASHVVGEIRTAGPSVGMVVVDMLTDDPSDGGGSVVGGSDAVDTVADAVTRSGADMVILASSDGMGPRTLRELGWALAKLDVNLVVAPSLTDIAGPRIHARPLAGLPLIHVDYPRLTGRAALTKRLFDIAFSLTALTLLAPVLVVLALAVRLDSRGPALFRQERIGVHHSRFRMLKFRSMVVDAEARLSELEQQSEGNGVLFKMRRDPRITRIGGTLRRYSLDELPQFLNVLRGDMSIVGPRPPLAREVDAYDDWAHRRLLVRPGITGLWQVRGRSDLSWEDSVRLDLYYVENWSLWTDIGIVLRTVRAVSSGSGAY
ncbi:MAG: sugar transferase [Nesterenkonia sp.]|nr:sugar transferase [Nesterenkonia sp.]